MEREESIGKIIEVSGGYRQGEIGAFDTEHVVRWVDQFQVAHQDIILQETANFLEKYYISKDSAKTQLRRLLSAMPQERIANLPIGDVNILQTQDEAKSQHDLLVLVDEILREEYGLNIDQCGGSDTYLYLDDCVYTGNKWRYDIRDACQLDEAQGGFTVVSYHLAIFSEGFDYAKRYIDSDLAKSNAVLKSFRHQWYNNARFGDEHLDIFFPEYVAGNRQVDAFIRHAHDLCDRREWSRRALFRKSPVATNLFTSAHNKHIVEQAFLAAGARMFCAAANPAPSMRPMGFEVVSTIGFGSPLITWRNIANNCPLALWYGDPTYGANHPLGMWYPLFPRKIT